MGKRPVLLASNSIVSGLARENRGNDVVAFDMDGHGVLGGPDHDHAVAFADLEPAQLRRHAVLDDWDFETRDRRIGGNGILADSPTNARNATVAAVMAFMECIPAETNKRLSTPVTPRDSHAMRPAPLFCDLSAQFSGTS